MPTQSIPLAHAWDMGQTEEPMEARFPWVRAGLASADGYAGEHVWMCFRGLQVPAGATIASATVSNLTMPDAGRLRCHAVADADPPGGMDALHAALAQLGTSVVKEGLTPLQQEAVTLFWGAVTFNGNYPPDTAEGMALIMDAVAWTYDYCVVQGQQTQSYNAMVSAFGPWATSWPYNWAGWTPAGGWDFDPPSAQTDVLPDLTACIQERVDALGWQPGNAVLLLVSPPEGAVEGTTVALSRSGTPVFTVSWEAV